jgi:hypothetical protein
MSVPAEPGHHSHGPAGTDIGQVDEQRPLQAARGKGDGRAGIATGREDGLRVKASEVAARLDGAKGEVDEAFREAQGRADTQGAGPHGAEVDALSGEDLLVDAAAHAQVEERQRFIVLGESLAQGCGNCEAGVDVPRGAAAG